MDNPPVIQNQTLSWLRAGFHDEFYDTIIDINEMGTPQEGIISPLLCNIALNGIREVGLEAVNNSKVKYVSKTTLISSFLLIRYANDFVAFHPYLDILEAVRENIIKFLKPFNLELHPDKTRTVHSKDKFNGHQPGFDFLSCHYFHNTTRKHGDGIPGYPPKGSKVGKKSKMRHYNWALRPSPSPKAIHKHLEDIRSTIRKRKFWAQNKLIRALNLKIRGWANYFFYVPH